MGKNSFNDKAKEKNNGMGHLPEWDLSAFYKSSDDPQIERDLQTIDASATAFAEKYKGKMAGLNAQELLACLQKADQDAVLETKLASYISLLSAKDLQEYSALEKGINQRLTDISTKTTFFMIEVSQIPAQKIQGMITEEPGLELYRVYLEKMVKMQPHMLGEEASNVASKMSMVGGQAWGSFFDQLDTRIRYHYRGQELTIEEVTNLRADPDRSVREDATKALYKGLNDHLWMFAYVTNTLSLKNAISDEMYRMPGPVADRNMSNNIDDAIVDAMNGSVTRGYPRVSHRYYEIVRQMLGLEKLKGWDRNAPLQKTAETKIPFDEAKKIVLDSYRSFSPALADIAQKFFDNNWIDAPVTKGKTSGAFSASCSVDTHPVVLLNYLGTPRDVATMAHELGHGCHQYLAAQHLKSEIASNTPLTIAETASVFGERVTFENLLAREQDPQKRIDLLAGKVNDMIGTVVRQNAFFNFEKELHATRKSKGMDLEPEEISKIYLKTQKEALGPAFDLDDAYGVEWAYIPHFIHTPYYVYAYVFGDCLVNSLYQKYQEADDKEAFAEKYIRLLEAGGSKPATELVKEFGLDLRDPGFWDGGMKAIEQLIDQLEAEIATVKASPAPKKKSASPKKKN